MVSSRSAGQSRATAADAQLARVADIGCGRHRHLAELIACTGPNAGRDIADAIHLLCSLYGRHPTIVELAYAHCAEGPARDWLGRAAEAFERERLYLVRLTSAVGPLPSTPGAAQTEASLTAQRHALETLAMSERRGCALGAATALVSDWWPIRRLLDRAAARTSVTCPPPSLPDEVSVVDVIAAASDTPASERALSFGGEQLLLQHRALFDLLEARSEAREGY